MDKKLMTLIEAADYLQISKWTVYRWIKEKNFPVYKIGGVDRFKKEEIDHWLSACKRN